MAVSSHTQRGFILHPSLELEYQSVVSEPTMSLGTPPIGVAEAQSSADFEGPLLDLRPYGFGGLADEWVLT